jgi:hypothetical protein
VQQSVSTIPGCRFIGLAWWELSQRESKQDENGQAAGTGQQFNFPVCHQYPAAHCWCS